MTDKDIVKILHLILYWPDNKGHWTAFAILAMFDITLLTREGIWFLWTGDFQHILQGLDLGLIWWHTQYLATIFLGVFLYLGTFCHWHHFVMSIQQEAQYMWVGSLDILQHLHLHNIFPTFFNILKREDRSAGSCHHIFTLPTLTPLQVSVGDIPKVWISDISDTQRLYSAHPNIWVNTHTSWKQPNIFWGTTRTNAQRL